MIFSKIWWMQISFSMDLYPCAYCGSQYYEIGGKNTKTLHCYLFTRMTQVKCIIWQSDGAADGCLGIALSTTKTTIFVYLLHFELSLTDTVRRICQTLVNLQVRLFLHFSLSHKVFLNVLSVGGATALCGICRKQKGEVLIKVRQWEIRIVLLSYPAYS